MKFFHCNLKVQWAFWISENKKHPSIKCDNGMLLPSNIGTTSNASRKDTSWLLDSAISLFIILLTFSSGLLWKVCSICSVSVISLWLSWLRVIDLQVSEFSDKFILVFSPTVFSGIIIKLSELIFSFLMKVVSAFNVSPWLIDRHIILELIFSLD